MLLQAAISSLENWQIFTGQITSSAFLGRRDLAILYETVADAVQKLKTVPGKHNLLLSIQERLSQAAQNGTPELDEEEWIELYNLVQNAHSSILTAAELSYWSGTLISQLAHQELILGLPELPTEEVGDVLRNYANALDKARAGTQFTDDDFNPMSESMRAARNALAQFQPTGISFIDKYVGGFANREMYSFLGPTGAAKTCCSVQVAAEWAELQMNRYRISLGRASLGKVFYITTEDGMDKVTNRFVSYIGKVPLAKISGKDPTPKTSSRAPTARDLEISKTYFSGVFGEVEREAMAMKEIAKNLRIIDLTKPEIRSAASDPIDVIVMMIQRALDADKQRGIKSHCALAVVDHTADLAFDMLSNDKKLNLWMAVQSIPWRIRDSIAYKFDCPVWVVNQANGEGNKKKAGQTLDHTDGMGSKSLAMHYVACFNVSMLKEEDMTSTITCTKARENKKIAPTGLRLIGDIGTMIEVKGAVIEVPQKSWQKKEKDSTTAKGKRTHVSEMRSSDN